MKEERRWKFEMYLLGGAVLGEGSNNVVRGPNLRSPASSSARITSLVAVQYTLEKYTIPASKPGERKSSYNYHTQQALPPLNQSRTLR